MKIKAILEYNNAEDDIERFEEIMSEILDLTQEAMQIVRESNNNMAYQRARSYWKGHIQQAVEKEDWFSMAATLNELRGESE